MAVSRRRTYRPNEVTVPARPSRRAALAGALLLPALAGCSVARMELPASLAAAPVYAVEGRNGFKIEERLAFGPWRTTAVERSWTSSPSLRINQVEWARSKQRYAFTMQREGTAAWRGRCEAGARSFGVHVAGGVAGPDDEAGLRCELEGGDGMAPGTLTLDARADAAGEGLLSGGEERLTVRGTRRLEGGALPADGTTGYTITDDAGAPLAAVEVINEGSVRLSGSLEPARRDGLAAAAVALLLLEDLRAHVDLTER